MTAILAVLATLCAIVFTYYYSTLPIDKTNRSQALTWIVGLELSYVGIGLFTLKLHSWLVEWLS